MMIEKISLDLGGGDAYPAEQPQAELDRDYSVMPEPEGKEYYWVLTGTHIFVSEESRKDDLPLEKHLNYELPSAHGTVEVFSRWNSIWTVTRSNMSLHLVEKRLKKYCKQNGWKYAGLVQVGENQKMSALVEQKQDIPWSPNSNMYKVVSGDATLYYSLITQSDAELDVAHTSGPYLTKGTGDPQQQVIYVDMISNRPDNPQFPVKEEQNNRGIGYGGNIKDFLALMAFLRAKNMPIYANIVNGQLFEYLQKFRASFVYSDYPGAGDNWPQEKDWRRTEWGLDNLDEDKKYFNITDPTDLDEPVGPQQCAFCGEIFPTWGSLVVHENKEHNETGKDPSNRWEPVIDYDEQIPADLNTNVMDQTTMRQAGFGPMPFVFDVSTDRLYVGYPGEHVSDVSAKYPGKFTPGGVVEGERLPDGKLQILTDTDMPYTIRHLVLLWQHMHPELEVKNIIKVDEKKERKIASVDTIGQKVINIANTDAAAREAFAALSPHGSVYIVGGAVRDIVLDRIPKDIDMMVQGIPGVDVQRYLKQLPGHVDFTGKSFGVYRYHSPDGAEVEIALPRAEMQGSGNVKQEFHTDPFMSVEDDLRRRDFTGNAMAVNMATGELTMAPDTNGVEDLNNRQLKVVQEQAFHDDPLRMLRAFTAVSKQGLNPTPETLEMIKRNAHRLSEVAPARLGIEMRKILSGDQPSKGVRHMFETGAMNHVIPELMAAYNFDQKNPHHRAVLHEHLLNVLQGVADQTKDGEERMAALLHDVGKPASQWFSIKGKTPRQVWTGPEDGEPHGHYYYHPELDIGGDHQTVGAAMATDILDRLKWNGSAPTEIGGRVDGQDRSAMVQHLIQHHMFAPFDNESQANRRINQVNPNKQNPELGPQYMRALLRLRRADGEGKGTNEWENEIPISRQEQLVDHIESQNNATTLKDLAIGGNDLKALGIPPGPQYSQILNFLLDQVIDNPALNDKNTLSQMALGFGQGKTANILDTIQTQLDPDVFNRPGDIEPSVKPKIANWVRRKVYRVMKDAGWPNPAKYVSLVLTGSLTTYQWSNTSDFDVSLWIDTNEMPDWQRSDLIALMVKHMDGTIVPNTTHPIQCFVVSPKLTKTELYKPGLRSAYDLEKGKWIVLPEKKRSIDVRREYPSIINYAMMMEEKMRMLLKYNPIGAREFWHQLHYRRHRDQASGKGDYSESNIVYKWLANSGLFPLISQTLNEYIAGTKTSMPWNSWDQWEAPVAPDPQGEQIVYHAAPVSARESIARNGLDPAYAMHGGQEREYYSDPFTSPWGGDDYGDFDDLVQNENRLWFHPTIEGARRFSEGHYDIYAANIHGIPQSRAGDDWDAHILHHRLPPNRIKLVEPVQRMSAAPKKPSKFHTTKEQHQKSLKERGPVKPHKRKTAAIDPEYLQKYIELNGPYLHHDTYQDAIPFILRDGILPRSQTGAPSEWDDSALESRPNHAYIGRRDYLNTIQGNGRMAGLRVDLRQLDPNLIDSDEDHHQSMYFDGHTPPPNGAPYIPDANNPMSPHSYDPEPWPSWGKWADDHTEQIDSPEFVRHSLDRGSVAIRGGVPAHAISADPHWIPPEDYSPAEPHQEYEFEDRIRA